jgi:hypothetical protein
LRERKRRPFEGEKAEALLRERKRRPFEGEKAEA